ncbi:hypothetical protein ACIA78_04930 [Streptomyces xanthochromogenes]|uniref:hypothetical protein n=1 Tax=Streptomyces xanthochromogenes TaxID=67384 RepID=UPI0037B81763
MTDKKPQSPAPLTDKQRVTQQVGITDMTTGAAQALSGVFPFGGRVRFFGKTDFEGHRLNEMIDLIHPANPQHLISAGDALFAAHEAISSAAAELRGHIGKVEWEGESGEAFRTWGNNLANHANRLAEFADTAGVQISAAGQGLVSVKSAMPPRDHRAEPVKVDDLPTAKRVAGNAEYEAALKVEQDRQEAINQMNRLSSFYSVSEQTLAAQEPPVFQIMPDVGVPKPQRSTGDGPWPQPVRADGSSPEGVAPVRHSDRTGTRTNHPPVETVAAPAGGAEAFVHEGLSGSRTVGTEINSAPPSLDTAPGRSVVAPMSPVAPVSPEGATPPPPTRAFSYPAVNRVSRALGGEHGPGLSEPSRRPGGAPGRGGPNPTGRVGTSGSEVARGGPPSAVGQSQMGRGFSGGTPHGGGAVFPREGTSGVNGGGRNGIVGGRPNAGAQGPAGPQRSKPTTIGSEGTSSRPVPTGRPSRKGVVKGAEPSTTGRPDRGGRGKGNADGVVGLPQGRSIGRRGNRSGFTSGGSGLVRASQEDRAVDDEGDETARVQGCSGGDEEMGKNA